MVATGPGGIKYFFNPADVRLARLLLNETGRGLDFQFGYGSECWFPDQINLKREGLRATLKLGEISCPENKAPTMDLAVPAGFSQTLISGR